MISLCYFYIGDDNFLLMFEELVVNWSDVVSNSYYIINCLSNL